MIDIKKLYDISVHDIMDMINEPYLENMNEMAVDRRTYIKRLESLKFQLVENWCLVYYCSSYDPDNQNYYHWLSELRAHYLNLQKLSIKSKCSKLKIISEILISNFEFDNPDQIYSIIEDKFYIEGITDNKILEDVSEAFTKNVHSLISSISSDIKFYSYIKETFGLVTNI